MRFLPLALLFVCFFSCGSDTADPAVTLIGDWELVTARNNGQETNVIRELTFGFGADGTFDTNMMSNQQTGTYVLTGQEIVTTGVKVPLTYSIEAITDSTLHLRTEVRERQLDFEMRRADAAE